MLHGSGGDAAGAVRLIDAATSDVLVLAPDSRGATWDVIRSGFGPDVAFLDAALQQVFRRHRVDERRIALAGFSDGASYALSLALANGDLFTHVLAFSPGFMTLPQVVGHPDVFVTHGVIDEVLPIEACSRRLVPCLQSSGYSVQYHEFAGGHVVPPDLAEKGINFLAGSDAAGLDG
jgi:phospholipase/carboxylesterase